MGTLLGGRGQNPELEVREWSLGRPVFFQWVAWNPSFCIFSTCFGFQHEDCHNRFRRNLGLLSPANMSPPAWFIWVDLNNKRERKQRSVCWLLAKFSVPWQKTCLFIQVAFYWAEYWMGGVVQASTRGDTCYFFKCKWYFTWNFNFAFPYNLLKQ